MTDVLLQDIVTIIMVCSQAIMAGLGFLAGVKLASLLSY